MKIEIISKVENGNLNRNCKLIQETLRQFEGKEIVLTIERKKKKRSNQQNRYLHASFTILKTELNKLGNNFNMEEVKELVKVKFLLIDIVNPETGEIYGQRVKGTSECSTVEMLEFIESMRKWAWDVFNIEIPEPSEQMEIIT